MSAQPVIRRAGVDYHMMIDYVAESGRRIVGGQGGIPSAGDILLLPDPDGRLRRWEIRGIGFDFRRHAHLWDVWTASLVPAPVALRVVA